MMTTNIEDLSKFMAGWREAPFSWPDNNCAHFPAAWVEHTEGAAPDMLKTASKWVALRRITLAGGMEQAITDAMGRQPLPDLSDVSVGDVVLFGRGVIAPGVVGVVGVAISSGAEAEAVVVGGAIGSLYPVSKARAVWRVGA